MYNHVIQLLDQANISYQQYKHEPN
ncbi:Protein of unknown function [Bacillus toyonensis]|nr:Protein of unknown function [Bacillus toyonensis]